jgi:homoserine kinase type II
MARHTNLIDADISAISKTYGLEITRCQPITGGEENSSFLLKTRSQDYVLTFYEKRSSAEVEQVVQLLNHLAGYGYHTNRVLPTSRGSYVSKIQGKPFIIKTWIPGNTLRDKSQEDYRSIGQAIAQLHDIRAPAFLSRELRYGLRVMPDALDHKVDLEYEAWLADKIGFLKGNFPNGLPQSLIHGDLFDDNIIYHNGDFEAIIDFADASHYHRVYDLGCILFGACMVDGRLNVARAADVLGGYQSRLRLEPEECEAVQFFAVYAGAAISAWHYLHTYLNMPLETRLGKYKLAAARTEYLYNLKPLDFDSLLK